MDKTRQHRLDLLEGKKIYFVSDQHFGAPTRELSKVREQKFITFLNEIQSDCQYIFLLGDLFDFWFEYKHSVPKFAVRVLGKLAEFVDSGIPVYFFEGNHDMWTKDYFQKELGFTVFSEPQVFSISQKKFFIGHGDGLGPGDLGYKLMKKIFTSKFFIQSAELLPSNWFMSFGQFLSVKKKANENEFEFTSSSEEWLYQYCQRKLEQNHYDYFLFGHRHLPLDIPLNTKSQYVNTGDWIKFFTYATFDGNALTLLEYK